MHVRALGSSPPTSSSSLHLLHLVLNMGTVITPQQHARGLDDELNSSSLPVVSCRSPDLFLADGNIVLRTRSVTTSGDPPAPSEILTHYKVHKAVLGLNCAAFKDLLEGTNDDAFSGSEMFEGVPVMDTHDQQEDLDVFLKTIYLHKFVVSHSRSGHRI